MINISPSISDFLSPPMVLYLWWEWNKQFHTALFHVIYLLYSMLNFKIHFSCNRFWYIYNIIRGLSSSRSYGSWIYNYLCNQCLSALTNVVSSNRAYARCTRYNIMWLAAGRWFSPGIPFSSTNKTDRHGITEILLKIVLNTITITL